MLIIRALEDIPERLISKGDTFNLYIVDAHHHMGKEGSHRNTPGGAYDFYQLLWFEMKRLADRAIEDDKLLFEPIDVLPPDFVSNIFSSRNSWKRMNHGWLVDRTIAFPYSDDYAKQGQEGTASFKISNDKIAGWTTRAPHSTRLIGFSRVDPTDAKRGDPDLAVRELERAVLELGLRGLKLHPLAQLFIDDLEDEMVRRVVHKTCQLSVPVLFDTRNIRTVTRIKHLIDIMRDDPIYADSIDNVRVIIAHCGMSPGSSKLYDVLMDPSFVADTSTLHGQDIPLLFEMAAERIQRTKRWSESLLFGTDYSFLSVQAAELILATLSREFPGDLSDAQRILGGNSLSIVQKPFNSATESKRSSKQLACPNDMGKSRQAVENLIIEKVQGKNWDLSSLDLMIPPRHTWPQIRTIEAGGYNGIHFDSYLVTLKNKSDEYEIHLWVRENPGDTLTIASVRTSGHNALRTTNYATHRVGESIIEDLSRNTNYEKDVTSLLEQMPKLLG